MQSRIKQSLSFLNNLEKIPLSADSVSCLFSTKSFKNELLKQISQAESRICLAALYIEADEAGHEILMALYQAKQKTPELDILICIDFHRAQRGLIGADKSSGNNATWYREVEDAQKLGIKIVGIPVKRKELFGVQHIKGFIFDDLVLYSGASLNNIYLHFKDKYRYDRYWLIQNKELANSMVYFLEIDLAESESVISLNSLDIPKISSLKIEQKQLVKQLRLATYKFKGRKVTDELSVVPLCGLGARRNKLNRSIHNVLQSTKQELVLFTPYFNLPRSIARDINRLLKEGVNIRIVVGDKTASDFYIPKDKPFKTIGALPYLYESNLKSFARKYKAQIKTEQLKLHLWKDGGNSFHLKGIYADNRFMLLTGHNLNPRAWRLDLENGLLLDDPKQSIKHLVDQELSVILKNTTRITNHEQIERIDTYPAQVKKLLLRMRRVKFDKIIKSLL